jgi:hypothetical protein
MKIELTTEEYHSLLQVVYLGGCVLSNHTYNEYPEKFNDLLQHLLSYAKEAGFFGPDSLVDQGPTGEYCLTENHNSEVDRYFDDYEMVFFLRTLSYNMAIRDLDRKYGIDAHNRIPYDQWLMEMGDLEALYDTEFLQNDLDNIVIMNGSGGVAVDEKVKN